MNIPNFTISILIITIFTIACSNAPKNNTVVLPSVDTTALNDFEAESLMNDRGPNKWEYKTSVNAMGDESKVASIDANDLVNFDFPYNGGSQGTILIRKKNNDLDIMFMISKGQIDTDYQGTYTRVKFDGDKPKRYLMSESSDNSSDVIFFNNEKALLEKIKKAKKMVVEVPFYQNGNVQFVFNVEKLEWN